MFYTKIAHISLLTLPSSVILLGTRRIFAVVPGGLPRLSSRAWNWCERDSGEVGGACVWRPPVSCPPPAPAPAGSPVRSPARKAARHPEPIPESARAPRPPAPPRQPRPREKCRRSPFYPVQDALVSNTVDTRLGREDSTLPETALRPKAANGEGKHPQH
ncbi:MAG: hypothetical protein BJ554DRAFT_2765 [Olpidium bornovanus]|uniref:Uncharacterized protein n=1 Tax=Olpidium bornovanus TaxID=278681 RepID=A0A8H8DGD9_9FUNG|nr:MAG: hypothetical protein BJ554DRAFT_2765 [Olpidium bornovanus]